MLTYTSFCENRKIYEVVKAHKFKENQRYKELSEHDKDTFRLPRQESERALLGGFWRLKCGKSGQESQRGTTVLLRLRNLKLIV